MKRKLLITSAGSLVGQCLLDCLADQRQDWFIAGTNSVALARNLYACDRAWLVPPAAEAEGVLEAMRRILREEAPDVVIPARDEDLPLLAALSADFPASRFLGPPAPLAGIFNDKLESRRFAAAAGLPFAASAFAAAELEALLAEYGFPLLAKPRWNGHASKDVYLVNNQSQIQLLLAEEQFVFQPLLNPATLGGRLAGLGQKGLPWVFSMNDLKYVAELVIGEAGALISLAAAEMRFEAGGKFWRVLEDSAIDAVARAYARELGQRGYRGPLNLQGKLLADGSFMPFELNGRFTGSANARALLGYNQVQHALAHFLAGGGAQPPQRSGPWLAAVETPKAYQVIPRAAAEALSAHGVWTA